MNTNRKQAVLSLSGGLDSSTLLLHLLSKGYECTCISFDYGQKHRIELERAKDLVMYLNQQSGPNALIKPIRHQVIKLDGLQQLLNSALVTGGAEVPEGHYAEENMKQTVVPNRNKIFSSIIQAVALSIAESKNTDVHIAMGIHAGDHFIYKDCRQEFRDIDYEAFKAGNWNAEKVSYYTPYLHTDKFGILQDGEKCCEFLHLNFDKVYSKTNTSYKPIQHVVEYNVNDHVWMEDEWFSDYKSSSSVERVLAFIKLGRKDPVNYADGFGPVTWEIVKNHALEIDKEFKEKHSDF